DGELTPREQRRLHRREVLVPHCVVEDDVVTLRLGLETLHVDDAVPRPSAQWDDIDRTGGEDPRRGAQPPQDLVLGDGHGVSLETRLAEVQRGEEDTALGKTG